MSNGETGKDKEKPPISREDVLTQAPSAYEAIVAIAKEARRLNAAPEVFLQDGEKAIPKAVENFVDGKVDYEIEGGEPPAKKRGRKSRKTK